jgi:hypothetical protein
MTDQSFPITPPAELVQQWFKQAHESADPDNQLSYCDFIAAAAAQWGADQELEACCEWTQSYAECGDSLRRHRRPKPPSLKEQALEALGYLQEDEPNYQSSFDTIRRALEALPND